MGAPRASTWGVVRCAQQRVSGVQLVQSSPYVVTRESSEFVQGSEQKQRARSLQASSVTAL
jgi:hypothetical protein